MLLTIYDKVYVTWGFPLVAAQTHLAGAFAAVSLAAALFSHLFWSGKTRGGAWRECLTWADVGHAREVGGRAGMWEIWGRPHK